MRSGEAAATASTSAGLPRGQAISELSKSWPVTVIEPWTKGLPSAVMRPWPPDHLVERASVGVEPDALFVDLEP